MKNQDKSPSWVVVEKQARLRLKRAFNVMYQKARSWGYDRQKATMEALKVYKGD